MKAFAVLRSRLGPAWRRPWRGAERPGRATSAAEEVHAEGEKGIKTMKTTVILIVAAALSLATTAMAADKATVEVDGDLKVTGDIEVKGNVKKIYFTEEKFWNGGDAVKLIRANDGVCFITDIRGNFAGAGERVYTSKGRDYWLVGGKRQQDSVQVGARCIVGISEGKYDLP
ncbi:MAG: hypothetical protein HY985_13780 [Magnetospirillum sp.]|nr:hypothetical protein [Magnetospirillum sp.]